MNREQRRHPEQVEPSNERPGPDPGREMREPDRPQDTLDPRAKNTGHKKKTADKWNQ